MPIIAADSDPILETERLMLRRLRISDRAALAEALNDWQVIEWLARVPFPYTESDAEDWISLCARDAMLGTMITLSAFDRATGQLVGSIGLVLNSDTEAELGYWLRRDCWGRGLATEMVQPMLAFGFDHMGLGGIIASSKPDNHRSIKVLEKNGFKSIGDRVYIRPPLNGALSGPHWYLTRQDFFARTGQSS